MTKGHQLIKIVIVIGGKTLQPLNQMKTWWKNDELTYYGGKMQTDDVWSDWFDAKGHI